MKTRVRKLLLGRRAQVVEPELVRAGDQIRPEARHPVERVAAVGRRQRPVDLVALDRNGHSRQVRIGRQRAARAEVEALGAHPDVAAARSEAVLNETRKKPLKTRTRSGRPLMESRRMLFARASHQYVPIFALCYLSRPTGH